MAEKSDNTRAEEWRAIPGWPGYEASDAGRLRSFKLDPSGRVAKQRTDKRTGYKIVSVRNRDGVAKSVKVHRLVCAAFHGAPTPSRPEVAHRDGSRDNNRPENLRWASRKENVADQLSHGTFQSPTHWGLAPSTRRVFQEMKDDGFSGAEIAAIFNIHPGTVNRRLRG